MRPTLVLVSPGLKRRAYSTFCATIGARGTREQEWLGKHRVDAAVAGAVAGTAAVAAVTSANTAAATSSALFVRLRGRLRDGPRGRPGATEVSCCVTLIRQVLNPGWRPESATLVPSLPLSETEFLPVLRTTEINDEIKNRAGNRCTRHHGRRAAADGGRSTDDAWRFHVLLYGYFPEIGGKSKFPRREGGNSSTSTPTRPRLPELRLHGHFRGQKGRWGIFTDVSTWTWQFEMNTPRPHVQRPTIAGGMTADADLGLVAPSVDSRALQGVRAIRSDVDLVAGARMLDIQATLAGRSRRPRPNQHGPHGKLAHDRRTPHLLGRGSWGSRAGVLRLERRMVLPCYLDVGTGDSTSRARPSRHRLWFKWGDIIAGGATSTTTSSRVPTFESINFNGPMVGVAFHW